MSKTGPRKSSVDTNVNSIMSTNHTNDNQSSSQNVENNKSDSTNVNDMPKSSEAVSSKENQVGSSLPSFMKNQKVLVQFNQKNSLWTPAMICDTIGNVMYLINVKDRCFRKVHVSQLKISHLPLSAHVSADGKYFATLKLFPQSTGNSSQENSEQNKVNAHITPQNVPSQEKPTNTQVLNQSPTRTHRTPRRFSHSEYS